MSRDSCCPFISKPAESLTHSLISIPFDPGATEQPQKQQMGSLEPLLLLVLVLAAAAAAGGLYH